MNENPEVVYITKYALTRGIIEKKNPVIKKGGTLEFIENVEYIDSSLWEYSLDDAMKAAMWFKTKRIEQIRELLKELNEKEIKVIYDNTRI